ncbi:AIR synthase family protein [Calorimonas adulescens]|uniref:AIR synthase n=1 Tax=Calorimonas adulescens TaxID=2606906 RepID=A0A5D8QE17_9THEO|nr:AIR synthase family protein [Calorimonas adulescens]TZE81763.1 AIR synthase [Calorimonas adulescens]
MQPGKLPNELMAEIVFSNIRVKRDEVLVFPQVGMDCGVIDFGEDVCVLSTDPITGTSSDIGWLGVHIACNDVIAAGVEPLGLMLTIMAPPGTTESELYEIMSQADKASEELNVAIVGGHTEITPAVTRTVLSTTAIGKAKKSRVMNMLTVKSGDYIIMTKTAGLEGTAIIATEREDELKKHLDSELVERAKNMIKDISVLKEGEIAVRVGVNRMHDATEGGVLGALWEMADSSGLGIEVYGDKIPVAEETRAICDYLKINPLRLISSGCLLIATSEKKLLSEELKKEGIKATVVGRIVKKGRYIKSGTLKFPLEPPKSDELYKVITN